MKALQHLPTVPMKRYGVNPYDEALYRVVFSDSRTDLIGGRWPDGACEYREVPRYPDIHAWVLEKWMTATEYAGEREAYERAQFDPDSNLYTCGPYPHRGEYQMCYVFPYAPGDGEITKIITAIKLSRDIHPAHQKEALLGAHERQEREADARFDAIWSEAQGGFAKASAVVSFGPNSPGGRQGWKRSGDMDVRIADKPLPLPRGDNFFGTIMREETIQELTGAKP